MNFILKLLTPFIKWFGHLHMPYTHKKITGEHYYNLRDKIEIGDVFLTRISGEFSNLINPTKLKHGAIYIGDIKGTGVRYVAEATGKGVVFTDLVTFLTTKDVMVICKPTFKRENFDSNIQAAALRFKGSKYDYLFSKGNEAFYCFELCVACFIYGQPSLTLMSKRIAGKPVYGPDAFLDRRFFEVYFDNRN